MKDRASSMQNLVYLKIVIDQVVQCFSSKIVFHRNGYQNHGIRAIAPIQKITTIISVLHYSIQFQFKKQNVYSSFYKHL